MSLAAAVCFSTFLRAFVMLADIASPMASTLWVRAVPTSLAAVLRCSPAWASSDFFAVLRVAMTFLLEVNGCSRLLAQPR
ncbi:MAG: hypothetical protein C0505_14295 [Leptothrix sp. (in: Bacteria)]|nr:hypothetical protein [Leptothrix sp. (in: b-proteobacteria)]